MVLDQNATGCIDTDTVMREYMHSGASGARGLARYILATAMKTYCNHC